MNPTGPYRAQAILDMADFMLFKKFEIDSATAKLNKMAALISHLASNTNHSGQTENNKSETGKTGHSHHPLTLTQSQFKILPASWQQAYCALLIRRGLIAWVSGHSKQGAALIKRSTKYRPGKADDFTDARSFAGDKMKWLIKRMKSGRMEAFGKSVPVGHLHHPRAGVVILLGEIYFGSIKLKPAIRYYLDIVQARGHLRPSVNQIAFAHIRLGQCANLLFKTKAAYKQYQTVLHNPKLSNTPWASSAALQSALLRYEANHNWRDAVNQLYAVYKTYPHSLDAANALYYAATLYQWNGHKRKARAIYKKILHDYSDKNGVKKMIHRSLNELKQNKNN